MAEWAEVQKDRLTGDLQEIAEAMVEEDEECDESDYCVCPECD